MKNIFSSTPSKTLLGRYAPKSTPQTAEITQSTQTREHPSKGLTPQKLYGILEAVERDDMKAQSELSADIEEKDGHIFSGMSKRKRAVIGLDWRIMPPPNSSDAERQLAKEIGGQFKEITDFGSVMFDLLDAVGRGFACVEVEQQQTGGLWLPKKFIHRPQGWFKADSADNVRLAKQGNPGGEELWGFGWIVHERRNRSGFLPHVGLICTLVWPYLFKNYSVRDLAEFLGIYGLPTRLGKYVVGADETDKITLLRAVKEIGHNVAGIIPETMNIEPPSAASGNSDPFMAMVDWADKTSSKAILGGTLTSMADGKTSINTLGQVHNEVRHGLLVSDAKQLACTITQQLVLPLLCLNKGNVGMVRLPRSQFDTQLPEDMAVYAESLPKLVKIGMKIPLSRVQEKLAIPLAPDDEPVLTLQTAESKDVKVAPSSYRRVALSRQGEILDTGQAAIDSAGLGKIVLPEHIEPFLHGLGRALAEGDSYEGVQDRLLRAYPHLDSAEFQMALARVILIPDLWGRFNG